MEFKPRMIIESLEPVSGAEGHFVVQSTREGKVFTVSRSFLDFQFLEQQLFRSGQNLQGYILPPFPDRLTSSLMSGNIACATPASDDFNNNPQTGGQQANGTARVLPGYGHFVSDEHQLLYWLRHVVKHPVFGKSGLVEPFLTETDLPPPGKISKPLALIKSIQDTIDSRKHAHKDTDPFFQRERDWSIKVHELMSLASDAYDQTINARNSLSQVLAHLSATLSLPIGDTTEANNKMALETNLALSRAMDGVREYEESQTINGAATLGATLHLWTRFIESEREMLKQRTCLLVDYEVANRNYDRAQVQRRAEFEEVKAQAERAFEKCSEIAHGEIQRLQSARVKDFARALRDYRDNQLALARRQQTRMTQLCQRITEDLKLTL